MVGLVFRHRVEIDPAGILCRAQTGNLAALSRILDADPGSVNDIDFEHGRSALGFALESGQVDSMRLLLKAGANPDLENDRGLTTKQELFISIQSRRFPAELCAAMDKLLPLSIVLNDMSKLSVLRKSVLGLTPIGLSSLLQAKDPQILSQLDEKDDFGITPLLWAVRRGDRDARLQLLAAGADPNVQPERGSTPFMMAMAKPSAVCAQALIDAGADIHAVNAAGENTLSHAVYSGNLDMVKLLIAKGVDPDRPDRGGSTALNAHS